MRMLVRAVSACLAAACCVSVAVAADWFFIDSGSDARYYLDRKTVSVDAGTEIRHFRLLADLDKPTTAKDGRGYNSQVTRIAADCGLGTFRPERIRLYTGRLASGEKSEEIDGAPNFAPIPKGSVLASAVGRACEQSGWEDARRRAADADLDTPVAQEALRLVALRAGKWIKVTGANAQHPEIKAIYFDASYFTSTNGYAFYRMMVESSPKKSEGGANFRAMVDIERVDCERKSTSPVAAMTFTHLPPGPETAVPGSFMPKPSYDAIGDVMLPGGYSSLTVACDARSRAAWLKAVSRTDVKYL